MKCSISPPSFKGGQAFHVGKKYLELGVGGDGQDTSRLFEGSFGSIRACEASEQKPGQKPESELKVT